MIQLMLTFHLLQETSKKRLEICDMSVYISKSNRCPWPYLTELQQSWQAGPVLQTHHATASGLGQCLQRGLGPSASAGDLPQFCQSRLRPQQLGPALTSAVSQSCHSGSHSRADCESWGVSAGCFLVPKEIKSVQTRSDLLPSRSIDTQFV